MLLGNIDTATHKCCISNEIDVIEGPRCSLGMPRRAVQGAACHSLDEVGRFLGSKRKFVKQCRIQPDFETIAVDKFDMIGQNFPACGDRCVECFDLQVQALNDAPGLHEVAAIHQSNFSTGQKSFDIKTKSR